MFLIMYWTKRRLLLVFITSCDYIVSAVTSYSVQVYVRWLATVHANPSL